MKVTEEELLTFSAELLAEYNIPLEFEKDGLYLQESIGKVCKKLNIHAVSKSFYCDCQVPKLINVTTNCRCEKCGKRPPRKQ